jgi:hypothetical protein
VCWASNLKIQFNGIGGLQTYIRNPDADGSWRGYSELGSRCPLTLPGIFATEQTKGQTSMQPDDCRTNLSALK